MRLGGWLDSRRCTWQSVVRALLDTLTERLAQVQPKTRRDTVTDVIVDILADRLAEEKPETPTDKLANLKAERLDDIRH